MRRSAKVATPATAFTLRVPDNVPPPGFAPRATVIAPVRSEERRVGKSSADTRTAGLITAPACVGLGAWGNRNSGVGSGGRADVSPYAPGSPPALARSV